MAGRGRRGDHGETHDRLVQPVRRFRAGEGALRELRELLKETRERLGRGAVEIAGPRQHLADDVAAGRGEGGKRDAASRDSRAEAEEPPHEGTQGLGGGETLGARCVACRAGLELRLRLPLALDERVEAWRVARGAREDARAAEEARSTDASDARGARLERPQIGPPVREKALQRRGPELMRDPVEVVEDALPGPRVRDGHAVVEGARNPVLGGELVDERPVRRVVVERDLHVVEAKAVVENLPKDAANLVLLAQRV